LGSYEGKKMGFLCRMIGFLWWKMGFLWCYKQKLLLTPFRSKNLGKAPIFFLPQFIFFDLKPHAKFWNPMITPSGRKVTLSERRRKNAVNSGHLVPWQRTQAAQANCRNHGWYHMKYTCDQSWCKDLKF
jgi:ribosomal protein L34